MLNNRVEYSGGNLCFFVNDKVHVVDRPAGSMTKHPAKVLHAVTALKSGTRKSLFVVDESNGLGDGHVLQITNKNVEKFADYLKSLKAREPQRNSGEQGGGDGGEPAQNSCFVCLEFESDHVLVPCGHLGLCSQCVTKVKSTCPICKTPIQSTMKIYRV